MSKRKLKFSVIHEGFDDKIFRDWFATRIQSNRIKLLNNKKLHLPPLNVNDTTECYEWSIASIEADIQHLQKKLSLEKELYAMHQVLLLKGYSEHDVSDYVLSESSYAISFIGTEQEYKAVLKKLRAQ